MTAQYLELLRAIKANGVRRGDRTGTGTTSLFGYQMRFDLNKGFPLLTTKRLWMKGVAEELMWFLRGDTNVNSLHESVQKWWTPWSLDDGELGPIYGEQFRRSRWWGMVSPRLYDAPIVKKKHGLFCGVGDVANTHRNDSIDDLLKPVWRDMIERCYSNDCRSYKSYGGKGVHVAPEWLHYPTFKSGAQKLNGWELKLLNPTKYTIDKDFFASNRYGPDTCMWLSKMEQSFNTSTNTPFTAVSPDGSEELFPSIGEAHRRHGLYVDAGAGQVMRFREVDQLESAIATIIHSPESRRNVINLWHTPAMGVARLPCCHGASIQFYVSEGKLSTHMHQRSADVFVGVPVNIASYALLTHLLAKVCGLGVGDFVHTFGDVHIYNNHIDQVDEQLSREPKELPSLTINDPIVEDGDGSIELRTILSYTSKDFVVTNYKPYPKIKGEVSV